MTDHRLPLRVQDGRRAGSRQRFQSIGIFCVSFDFELAWGNFDRWDVEALENKCRIARKQVLPRLLEMLHRHAISATWAVVGHLMLDRCDGRHGGPAPRHDWLPDWYRFDPASSEDLKPEWYARSFVQELVSMKPAQDVGLHGFSHCIWNDPGCTIDTAFNEMDHAMRAAAELGIAPRSFVFPRNAVGHLDVLADSGFLVFREPRSDKLHRLPEPLRRAHHFLSQLLSLSPPPVRPRAVHEMVALPFSSLYPSMDGMRRLLSVGRRVRRSVKGMARAIRTAGVYHLTTHPVYLAYGDNRMEKLLDGLDRIFSHARMLADRGEMHIRNMKQIALDFQRSSPN